MSDHINDLPINEIKSTDELQTELESAINLSRFLSENEPSFHDTDVTSILNRKLQEHNVSKATLARMSGMSEVYLYQILSGRRLPSRNRLICLGLGLSCSLEELQELLRMCGYASLYAKHRRDSIIMYGIAHNQNLFTINDNLFMAQEETLN